MPWKALDQPDMNILAGSLKLLRGEETAWRQEWERSQVWG